MVWERQQRSIRNFDLEVVARIAGGFDDGGGTVPCGVGLLVVASALHGRPLVLVRVGVLQVPKTFKVILVSEVAEQSERCVEHVQTPKTEPAFIEEAKSRAPPTMHCCTVGDTSLLVAEAFPAFRAREMEQLYRYRRRAHVCELVSSDGVENLEAIVEVPLSGDAHVDPSSLCVEGAVDQ